MGEIFKRLEAEPTAALSQGLVLPAYDYVLKCNQTFNVLDARGAVGVTERQAYFRQMRELARNVAEVYLKQRQELEYPLLKEVRSKKKEVRDLATSPLSNSHFLLEIGTEELPSGDVDTALAQLRQRVPSLLNELSLEHGSVTIEGTPRRLAVFIESLS